MDLLLIVQQIHTVWVIDHHASHVLLEPTVPRGLLHALHALPISGQCLGQHVLPTQGIMMLEPA